MLDTTMNPNSALYWLSKVVDDLPIPRTVVIPVDASLMFAYGAGESSDAGAIREVEEQVERAAMELGYPCFIRTDQSSAKHAGPAAYRIDSAADVHWRVWRTVEDTVCKDLDVNAILVRAWLELDAPFGAFGYCLGEKSPPHPIAREWRFFATKDRVICSHFYWVKDALKFRHGEYEVQGLLNLPDVTIKHWLGPKGWQKQYYVLSRPLNDKTHQALSSAAIRAAASCDAASLWSVDFAQDVAGRWWLIDMAVGEASWHPDGCQRLRAPLEDGAKAGTCSKCGAYARLVMVALNGLGFCGACLDSTAAE